MAFLQRTCASLRQGVLANIRLAANPGFSGLRAFGAASYLDKADVTDRIVNLVKNFDRVEPSKASWRGWLGVGVLWLDGPGRDAPVLRGRAHTAVHWVHARAQWSRFEHAAQGGLGYAGRAGCQGCWAFPRRRAVHAVEPCPSPDPCMPPHRSRRRRASSPTWDWTPWTWWSW